MLVWLTRLHRTPVNRALDSEGAGYYRADGHSSMKPGTAGFVSQRKTVTAHNSMHVINAGKG